MDVLKHWKRRTFCAILLAYAFIVFNRSCLAYGVPAMIDDESIAFTKKSAGLLASSYNLAYAGGRLFGGMASDLYSSRRLLALCLFGAGFFNLIIGTTSHFYLWCLCSILSGLVQSVGWPSIAKLLSVWYDDTERGTYWSGASLGQTGAISILAFVGPMIVNEYGWRIIFLTPGFCAIVTGIIILYLVKDHPSQILETSTNSPNQKTPSKQSPKPEKPPSPSKSRKVAMMEVLTFPPVLLNAICNFIFSFIRTSYIDWGLLFLVQHREFSYAVAGSCHMFFAIGGMLGASSCGVISDKFFNGNRVVVNRIFVTCLFFSVLFFWYAPSDYILNCILIFILGSSIYGPYTLVGLLTRESCDESIMGTAESFVAMVGNVGAVCAGYPLSIIIHNFGWHYYHLTLAVLVTMSLFIQFFLMKQKQKRV